MNQDELIRLHQQFKADAADADLQLRDSYEHLLLALRRIIESHGPMGAYHEWVVSRDTPTELDPHVVPAS